MTANVARRFWLPEESKVIDRYIEALAAGRYRYLRDAATACLADLDRLYARIRKSTPGHLVAATGRTKGVVQARFRKLLRERGLVWGGSLLLMSESKLVKRYAQALARGRFPDALRAAEECLAEVRRLPSEARTIRPRSLHTIHCAVLTEAHRMRRPWPRARYLEEEERVMRRFGRALARGVYASAVEATAACRRELARRMGYPRPGVYRTSRIRSHLLGCAHAAGWTSFLEPWSPAAQRVIKRYLRRLYTGEFRSVPAAATECTRELRYLPAKMKMGRPARTDAVLRELTRQARRLSLPRHRTYWHPGELRIIEAYARRVGRGDFASWREAAVACRKELEGYWTQATRRSPVAVRRPAGRGVPGIHGKMLKLAHELHLSGPNRRAWTERESQVVASWVRWYDRYRTPRKRGPLGVAASGLQEELENKGFTRTVIACRTRLKNGWLQMHKLA